MLEVAQHPMVELVSKESSHPTNVTLSKDEETMVNHFLLHFDAANGDTLKQAKVLTQAKTFFSYNPDKANYVCLILTENL